MTYCTLIETSMTRYRIKSRGQFQSVRHMCDYAWPISHHRIRACLLPYSRPSASSDKFLYPSVQDFMRIFLLAPYTPCDNAVDRIRHSISHIHVIPGGVSYA